MSAMNFYNSIIIIISIIALVLLVLVSNNASWGFIKTGMERYAAAKD